MGVVTQGSQKPALLIAVEQCEAMKMPLVDGGLMDQPHIWIRQVEMVRSVREEFAQAEVLAEIQEKIIREALAGQNAKF